MPFNKPKSIWTWLVKRLTIWKFLKWLILLINSLVSTIKSEIWSIRVMIWTERHFMHMASLSMFSDSTCWKKYSEPNWSILMTWPNRMDSHLHKELRKVLSSKLRRKRPIRPMREEEEKLQKRAGSNIKSSNKRVQNKLNPLKKRQKRQKRSPKQSCQSNQSKKSKQSKHSKQLRLYQKCKKPNDVYNFLFVKISLAINKFWLNCCLKKIERKHIRIDNVFRSY